MGIGKALEEEEFEVRRRSLRRGTTRRRGRDDDDDSDDDKRRRATAVHFRLLATSIYGTRSFRTTSRGAPELMTRRVQGNAVS